MPNLPISQLPQSSTLQGDELFVDVQGGVTKYTTLDNILHHHSQHISTYSSASQNLTASGSAQPVTFTSVWTNKQIDLQDNNKFVLQNVGTYSLSFTATVTNTDNAVHDAWFWIKFNGIDYPFSTKRMTVAARKNADTPSSQQFNITMVGVSQNVNDYVELYWTSDSTTVELTHSTNGGSKPESPSSIASIVRVG